MGSWRPVQPITVHKNVCNFFSPKCHEAPENYSPKFTSDWMGHRRGSDSPGITNKAIIKAGKGMTAPERSHTNLSREEGPSLHSDHFIPLRPSDFTRLCAEKYAGGGIWLWMFLDSFVEKKPQLLSFQILPFHSRNRQVFRKTGPMETTVQFLHLLFWVLPEFPVLYILIRSCRIGLRMSASSWLRRRSNSEHVYSSLWLSWIKDTQQK